ncbi:MAG: hypothetical protein VXZ84_00095 [Planctomycetota bacterium]|nr:hypothetical protein [Planctomycetota bacterium]
MSHHAAPLCDLCSINFKSLSLQRLLIVGIVILIGASHASDADGVAAENAAIGQKDRQQYLLRYRFKPGDRVRTKVVHQASVRTTIEGTSQTAKTVSVSVKVWKIVDIDANGQITFEHEVEFVDMKNDITGRETVSYDSREEGEPPAGFEDVARRVGVPLTRVVMDQTGILHQREELAAGASAPTQLVLPLPKEKISVGSTWTFPDDVVVQLRNGNSRKIKCRQRFELVSVENEIAKISIATQILTPIRDYPEIEAQLVQRESEGVIEFDLQAGRVVAQQIDLDRRVTGYPNAKSSMHYRTRFTETLLADPPRTARRHSTPNEN